VFLVGGPGHLVALGLLVAGAMLPPQRAPVSVDHPASRVTGG
jgi:hypothetical protein